MNTITKLTVLTEQQKKSYLEFKDWQKNDDIKHLSPLKHAGWKRILSSIATTEAAEQILMEELKAPYQHHSIHLDYLVGHQQDEQKHYKHISQYIETTFRYKKTKRTLSDKILYDTIFPKLFKSFVKQPVYGLALLLFFEIYAVTLYKKIQYRAQGDELPALSELIKLIRRDEQRHIAGASILFYELKENMTLNLWTKILMRFFLALALFDLNMNAWALHNRQIRKHMFEIGIDPSELTAVARSTARKIYNRFVT